jgi:ribosomal protein L40E
MKQYITPKCRKCGKRYPVVQMQDFPMVSAKKDGKTINICMNCIADLGLDPKDKETIIQKFGG